MQLLQLPAIVTPGIGLVFWTALVFVLLVIVLGKFVWPAILGAVEAREKSIEEALAAAEIARQAKSDLEKEIEKIKQEGRTEREKLLKEARETATALTEEARQKATVEYNRIVEDAKAEIERQKQQALGEVKSKVAEISLEIAEKLIRKQLSNDASQQELVKSYLKETPLN
ncbi:F0F1 ATP synthase subunit B [Hugenholtzia roseola]|uniref:F0F1 ATP synthase subunit B n=1 Tax=Hugenholtzia roseola TaxID=1002 RepID=UPI00040BA7D3|nr:F0F1 ATP synthase subunit B [Hugenholtzia roseola]